MSTRPLLLPLNAILILAGGLACVTPLSAATLYAVTRTQQLVRFDSATPGTLNSSVAVTGMGAGETVLGIDVRPATGELMALGSQSRVYRLDPATGVATAVGDAGAFALIGTDFGFDFNPVPDRIRVVSDADQNLRLNPVTGALAANDVALAYAAGDLNAGQNPNVVASAYTNSFAGTASTTLYGIDNALDRLVTQNPPNNGTLNTVGALGVDVVGNAAFDIQTTTGPINLAFAALSTDGAGSGLYSIDLTSGAAILIGNIGAVPTLVDGLAVLSPNVLPNAYGVTTGNQLVRFNLSTPEALSSSLAITGTVANEDIIGLDSRPLTRELFGLGAGSRLYRIDPSTAVATQIGVDGAFTLSGTQFGFDFNPTVDRLRVVSDNGQNLRLNPLTGALAANDTVLAYATGDVNQGQVPFVIGSGYTNSVAGATVTTLYGIDVGRDVLVIQNPPNNGTLNTVGGLGLNAVDGVGFDLASVGIGRELAYATLSLDGLSSSLYSINLATGVAARVGAIGPLATVLRAFAIDDPHLFRNGFE